MADSLKWRSKIILAEMEAAYGDGASPTGANAMLMTNVAIRPMEGDDVSRELDLPFLGNQATLAGGLRVTLTGSTELAGSGAAGAAPAWGVLARACALAETVTPDTSVAYTPISDAHESCAIHLYIEGTRHVMTGVRGSGVLELPAQGVPRIAWTLTGLFSQPSEQSRPAPDLSAFEPPLLVSDANTPDFTINSVDMVLRTMSLDFGNQVEPRLLVNREEIKIVNKAERLSCTVEAVALGTLNPYALAAAKTPVEVEAAHGTQAGNIATINAPACEMQRPEGYENAQDVAEWPLALNPLPVSGNDQFSLTLT